MARAIFAFLIAASAMSAVQAKPPKEQPAPPPEQVASIIVYGSDPCPKGADGEIVVSAHEPESERYRLPKRFRGKSRPPAQSWTNRVATLDEVSRPGFVNSCSAVGSGGATGCQRKFLSDMRAQRQADKAEAADIP